MTETTENFVTSPTEKDTMESSVESSVAVIEENPPVEDASVASTEANPIPEQPKQLKISFGTTPSTYEAKSKEKEIPVETLVETLIETLVETPVKDARVASSEASIEKEIERRVQERMRSSEKKEYKEVVEKIKKERFTTMCPIDILERARNISFWTPNLSLADIVQKGIELALVYYEGEDGPYEKRTGQLKLGRRKKT